MRIKKIQIKNFKSLVDFELEDLKPFCAFVGPNASGKSNIFEALELTNYIIRYGFEATSFFGNSTNIVSFISKPFKRWTSIQNALPEIGFFIEFQDEIFLDFDLCFFKENGKVAGSSSQNYFADKHKITPLDMHQLRSSNERKEFISDWKSLGLEYENDYETFIDNFSRLFVGKTILNRTPTISGKLAPDASNLSQTIGNIFNDKTAQSDFIDWLRILIPEFKNIEIKQSNIDGSFEFFIYEKGLNKPFPKHLISDGTYNILALMAAVYQTDEPQFLCIEEPENGLHPQAIQLLVDFFREKCEEKGHHIWLNTHSQTLVRCLEAEEIILVNKVNGETIAKQLTKEDNIDIKTDEAWLSNALGGGILWSR